jgi:FAD/FMN-containing dehydrogenase
MPINNQNTASHTVDGTSAANIDIAQVRSAIRGQVITSEDSSYNDARTVFYGGIDRHPTFIVQAANANDVAYIVSLARETGTELAVRSGGHSVAGHGVSEGGIVLDLSAMKGLEIDVDGRTAWADSGLTAGEYTAALGKHGLATGFGDTGSVGIGGITLGGGVGFFVRKFGLTIDDLLAAEIVTADGQIRHVDAANYADLFWAIRGGGGNFGVVTRFKYRLHEVGTVVGGMLILPASPEILHAAVAVAEAAPEELSMIINVMIAPPLPFVPSEYHGQLITFILPIYVGAVDAGEKAIAPLRAIATPLVDMVAPMPYPEVYPPEAGGFHPIAAAHTMFIDAFDGNTANTIFEHLRVSDASMAVTQIRVLGGAMARVPVDATAFAHRHRRMMVNVAAMYENPADAAIHQNWVKQFVAALQQGEAGAYVNFLGDEGAERVREAYPGATWERLQAIKTQYDPHNVFRLNQNIPPTVSEKQSAHS